MLKSVKPFAVRKLLGRLFYSEKASSTEKVFEKDSFPSKTVELLPISRYGGQNFVTLIVGATLMGQRGESDITRLFETAMIPVQFERIRMGPEEDIANQLLLSVQRNRSALQVCMPHDPVKKHESLMLNNDLDLFVSVIKLQTYHGYNCRFPDISMTLITQNNSGDYSKLEYEPVKGIVETIRNCDDDTIRRYLRYVFDYAKKHRHSKITIGHKRSELPLTDGRFIKIAEEVFAEKKIDIKMEFMPIDTLVFNLVMKPGMFDLICTSDRYGTFVASIASAVCGGAGLFSATELSEHHAVFKPLEAKLSLTDCRVLCPYGIVRSCIDLLEHLGTIDCANALEAQLICTMMDDGVRTQDFGGTDSNEFVISHIVNGLRCTLQ